MDRYIEYKQVSTVKKGHECIDKKWNVGEIELNPDFVGYIEPYTDLGLNNDHEYLLITMKNNRAFVVRKPVTKGEVLK